jgi:hypothetical protein
MNRKTNIILGAMAAVFLAYVLIRAWFIPITVDESSTAISHVPRGVFDTLFFKSDANPNNHILNTLLIKALTGIWSWHPMVFRLPVLLGAVMYAWAGFLLCRQLSGYLWVQVFAFAMLLGQPYCLEFFSVARGYGLGMGLMMFSIWYSWQFITQGHQKKHLAIAAVFAGFAVYANFTLLLFLVPMVGLTFLSAKQASNSFLQFFQKTSLAISVLGLFTAFLYVPLSRLSKHSELKNWNPLETLFSSAEKSMRTAIHKNQYLPNDGAHILAWLGVIFTVGIILVALYRWIQKNRVLAADPRFLPVALLAGALLTNVVQVEFTKTPYLEPRLALFYWPLFALSMGVTAAWLQEHSTRWAWSFMAPMMALAIVNMARCVNLRESHEWWHDQDTYKVFDYLKQVKETEERKTPYTMDATWLLLNSFMYHVEKDPRGFNQLVQLAPWHADQAPGYDYEFLYLISPEAAQPVMDRYEIVMRSKHSSTVLLRRKN